MNDLAIDESRAAGIDEWLSRAKRLVEQRFGDRIVVLSPPRSGSTPVARMLWETAVFASGYHCHEPFEARYWGGRMALRFSTH
jgi:hypothetical protein